MNQISGKFVAEAEASLPGAPPAVVRALWSGDFHRLRLRLYALIVLVDGVLMAAAFLLANTANYGRPFASYGVNTFALLFPIYLAVGLNGGAWSMHALAHPRRSALLAVHSLLFAVSVATVLLFSLKIGEDFSRLVFGVGSLLSLLMIAVGRQRLGEIIGRRCAWTFRREVLIVDGVPAAPAGTEVVVNAEHDGLCPVMDDPAMLDRLGRLLDRSERVILSCPPARREAWCRMLRGANVEVEILAPELERWGALALRRHGERATLLVGCGPLGLRQRAIKRGFDLIVAVGALLVLSPLLALIAAAIRLESPGPALFRQARMGRGNRLFHMLKFRTMYTETSDAEGVRSTSRDDDRITRLGRFLRSSSFDELPQLLNVLRGEMSIVGPRPHALGSTAEDESFWAIDDRYWDRHGIKPGITGEAQIRGFRGATETREDLTNRLKADLEYLDRWTIGRDLEIVARTVKVMIHRNAY